MTAKGLDRNQKTLVLWEWLKSISTPTLAGGLMDLGPDTHAEYRTCVLAS